MTGSAANAGAAITDPGSARGRLLKCAAELFREKGYERTTVRDLASAVGIQSGSIFHHFKSKEEILRAVMEETILFNLGKMRQALAGAANPKARLLALIRCELESICGETGAAMSVLVYEWRSLNADNQKHILGLRDIYEQIWLDALNEAKAEGLVVAEPFVLRRFLTGALGWTTNWYDASGDMTIDQLAEQALLLAVKQ